MLVACLHCQSPGTTGPCTSHSQGLIVETHIPQQQFQAEPGTQNLRAAQFCVKNSDPVGADSEQVLGLPLVSAGMGVGRGGAWSADAG
jgi:hypothetical protein